MTHAALKDLDAAKVVECVRNALESHRKGLPEEWQDFIVEQVRDLSNAIAALSAMEGEVVAWPNRMVNLPCPDGSTDRIVGFRVPEGDPILGKHGLSEPLAWLRKVTIERTAPPPQQAEREREAFIRGYKHGACHYIGGDVTEELHEAACWAVDHQSPDAGVFPTPSPGPQKFPHEGLPADFPLEILDAAKEGTPDYWLGYLAGRKANDSPGPQGGGVCKECGGDGFVYLAGRPAHPDNMLSCTRCATPPAHQPGEVAPIARDESYDRTYIPLPGGWEVQTKGTGSTFRICDPKGDRLGIPDSPYLHKTLEQMARDIHAAVNQKAALAPKEAGHDR